MERMDLVLQKMEDGFSSVNSKLDSLQSIVSKHSEKLISHEVFNAQVNLTTDQLNKAVDGLEKSVAANTKFVTEFKSSLAVFKWLFGFVGIGNLIMFLKVIFNLF